MPYITQDKRPLLDQSVSAVLDALRQLESDGDVTTNSTQGNINYVFTRILDSVYSRRYDDINAAMGVLSCVSAEFYRKKAAPYEDQKCLINGEVFEE